MASFRSTRSSRSRGFASLRLRSGSTSSKRGSGQGVEDDIPSEADHPFVWALRKPAVLDWAKGLSDEAQREHVKRMFKLPVDVVPGEVYLGDAVCARDVARLSALGITHVLNAAGAAAAAPRAAYEAAGIETLVIEAKDEPGYPMLVEHLDESRAFVARAKAGGGAVLVHCVQGLNRSGVLVAAEVMLSQRRTVLDAVKHVRARRGNDAVSNKTFQRDLVDLARREDLLGAPPGEPDSVVAESPPPRPATVDPGASERRRAPSLWTRLSRSFSSSRRAPR